MISLQYLTGIIVIIASAVIVCHFRNKKLFISMHEAESEVRRRCLQRPRKQIVSLLDESNIRISENKLAEEIWRGIADVIGVPPETLRADDRLAELCRVQLSDLKISARRKRPDYLISFSYELLDFLAQYLNENQWLKFLSAIGVSSSSEDVILSGIMKQRLADIVRLMAELRAEPDPMANHI